MWPSTQPPVRANEPLAALVTDSGMFVPSNGAKSSCPVRAEILPIVQPLRMSRLGGGNPALPSDGIAKPGTRCEASIEIPSASMESMRWVFISPFIVHFTCSDLKEGAKGKPPIRASAISMPPKSSLFMAKVFAKPSPWGRNARSAVSAIRSRANQSPSAAMTANMANITSAATRRSRNFMIFRMAMILPYLHFSLRFD